MKNRLVQLSCLLAMVCSQGCGNDSSPMSDDMPDANVPDETTAVDTLSNDPDLSSPEQVSKSDATQDAHGTDAAPCECFDELDCTMDQCSLDGCAFILKPGHCLIDGVCFEEGQPHLENPCLECVTAVEATDWTADNLNSCDDGDPCTEDDGCHGGQCLGKPILCPQDDNPCTSLICDDGQCTSTNLDQDCDDGDPCTLDDICKQGSCTGQGKMDCNDENDCTDDSCIPGAGCMHASNSKPCDNGNPCTVGDSCAGGACQHGPDSPDCNDDSPCTDDSCHPVTGCSHFPNAAVCDDGDPCFKGDFCVGGACQSGPLGVTCDDDNPCTDDSCQPFAGCSFAANSAPCDDGDSCFSNDQCADAKCAPGPTPLECDDANPCTDDLCVSGEGCQTIANTLPCDDNSLCTTSDVCTAGQCGGIPIVCDDANPCTSNVCLPNAGCICDPLDIPECRPQIVIDFPQRGATLDGQSPVTVTGAVTSPAGTVTSFTINAQPVQVGPDGAFSHPTAALQGMNLIIAEAKDDLGGVSRTAPSYYLSTTWYAVDAANPEQSMVPDGIMIFLGPEVWDDDDPSDVDDMATIMTYFMDSLDLASLVKNPVTTGTFGWCSYKVNVNNITYGQPSIDLAPISGGLHMFVIIPNFKADIEIDMSGFACPDLSGTATATSITIDTDVLISSDGNGITATMENTNVKVNDLNINVDGILGFLFNWLIDFFEGTFAAQLEDQFKQELGAVIPATVVDALNSLALDETILVPPFLGDGDPVKLELRTGLSSAVFTPAGGTLGLKATVVTPKLIQHTPLGSIGRASCLSGGAETFQFPMDGSLEMALHDDFFNQLPFGMYWGALFQAQVDAAEFGIDLAQYGLDQAQFDIDFLLPPILTDCTADGVLVLQIGDIQVKGDLDLYGFSVQMTMYASMEVEAELVAVDAGGTKQLSISLGDPRIMEVEITEVTGALAEAEGVLIALVKENLLGSFLDSFAGGALGSFPIPEIDLAGLNPGIPPGSSIAIDLQKLLRVVGYTVLSGNVAQ